jgi:hypothetical protein
MGHLFFKMKLPDAGARSSVRSLERAACVLDEQLRGEPNHLARDENRLP